MRSRLRPMYACACMYGRVRRARELLLDCKAALCRHNAHQSRLAHAYAHAHEHARTRHSQTNSRVRRVLFMLVCLSHSPPPCPACLSASLPLLRLSPVAIAAEHVPLCHAATCAGTRHRFVGKWGNAHLPPNTSCTTRRPSLLGALPHAAPPTLPASSSPPPPLPPPHASAWRTAQSTPMENRRAVASSKVERMCTSSILIARA